MMARFVFVRAVFGVPRRIWDVDAQRRKQYSLSPETVRVEEGRAERAASRLVSRDWKPELWDIYFREIREANLEVAAEFEVHPHAPHTCAGIDDGSGRCGQCGEILQEART